MIELRSSQLVVRVNVDRGAMVEHVGRTDRENALFLADPPTSLTAFEPDDDSEAAWMSSYRGGWQELFPNAGTACIVEDVAHRYHGEGSTDAWEVVAQGSAFAKVRYRARMPLVLERTMRLADARPALLIEERIISDADLPYDIAWGHHPAFDVAPGATIDLPAGSLEVDRDLVSPAVDLMPGTSGRWPIAAGRDGSEVDLRVVPGEPTERVVYLPELTAGWAAIRDPRRGLGTGLSWDLAAFPHAWLWQDIGGSTPFVGRRSRITGIEPQTFWPADGLLRAVGRGRSHRVEAHGSMSSWLTLSLFEPAGPVRGIDRDGTIHEES